MTDRRIDPKRSQRGFTLAEILVTTAIFAIIMIAALAVYDKSNQVFKQSTEAADMQQSTRIGFDKLVADVRMAGFDYSRGGIPSGDGQFNQPDEQIEYAGVTALAFRANLDYNSDALHGNGLEDNPAAGEDYTPKKSGTKIFPYVTTGNDEIIIYALRSNDNTKNTESLSFWVDYDKPRSAFQGSPTNGKEKLLKVSSAICSTCGIDTTNANPPYTLYRMSVADVLAGQPGTPVAENIRSLTFHYFTDRQGSTALADPDVGSGPVNIEKGRNGDGSVFPAVFNINSVDVYTGAIGGAGQFDAGNAATANVADRSQRTLISSVRVDLIGMNAQMDGGYTHPTETIAAIQKYRQYDLHALVVPRNLGLTGYPEPTTHAPGPPTITGMCSGSCATPILCWSAPTTGGAVLKYTVNWGLSALGPWDTYAFDVVDPSATSLNVPDDVGPPIDPSKTWFYQIIAVNDSGASQPSNAYSVVPKNATKPLPPNDLKATTTVRPNSSDPTAIDNTITLTWSPATDNDAAASSVTCSGSGCSGSADKIPPSEKILYQIYRGTDRFFTIDKGVPILSFASTQPAVASSMTFADAPATSAYPPGTCVQYYYRIMAADRCIASDTYNVSGDKNSSLSVAYPDDLTNQPGADGIAHDAGVKASAPVTLGVDTVNSACPNPPSKNCSVILQWPKVTTDSNNNPLGVDRYKIIRSRKKLTDLTWVLDTTMDAANGRPYVSVGGYSQTSAGTASYEDTTGAAEVPAGDGRPWYYQYTVEADDCSGGAPSPAVVYPTACSINPAIVQAGAQNPAASGDSPAQAWVMSAGDSITVTPPGAVSVKNVQFELTTYPGGVVVGGYPVTINSPGPYILTWTNLTDLQVYLVKITVLLTNGCEEVHVKYVQDQQATACAVGNVVAVTPTSATSGSTTTVNETYTIPVTGPDAITISGKPISMTWNFPDVAHNDMTFNAIVYTSGVTSTSDNFADFRAGTKALLFPAHPAGTAAAGETFAANSTALAAVPGGSNLTMTLRWQFKKTDGALPASPNPLQKLCIAYTIAAEPGVTKFCNIVGQAGTTANPSACD
ncbi:MAG: fibronectin type III domain-containing protein [Acidobacteriota bacterium]